MTTRISDFGELPISEPLPFAGNRSIYTLPKSIQTFYFSLVSDIRTEQTHNPTDMSEMSMKPYSLQKTNKFSEKKSLEDKFFLMKWPLIWGTFVSFPVCKKAATLAMPPCCCWVINLDGEDRDILDGWSFSRGVGKQKHPKYHLDLRKLGWLWWKHLGCKLGLEKNTYIKFLVAECGDESHGRK